MRPSAAYGSEKGIKNMQLQISVKDEDMNLFKRAVRRLLESTFILKEKDRKLYQYLARESNRMDVSDYLRMIGYDVYVDERTELAMLVVHEEDAETVGLKRANIVTFSPLQYHLLLALWEIYLENLGMNEAVYVTRGDLIDKLKTYLPAVGSAELKAAFRLFKKYSFIEYDENDGTEEGNIRLYASLQFGWDLEQFRTVASEYLSGQADGEDENGGVGSGSGQNRDGGASRGDGDGAFSEVRGRMVPEDDLTDEEGYEEDEE